MNYVRYFYFCLFLIFNPRLVFSKGILFDIEWIIQGKNIIHDGFFYEFLGIQKSLLEYFPYLRLTKSHFIGSYNESPISLTSNVYHSLSNEQKIDILNQISFLYPKSASSNLTIPEFRNSIQPKNLDSCTNINLNSFDYILDDLAKPIVTNIQTPQECCHACVEELLCIGWEFGCSESQVPQCHLKGQLLKSRPFYFPVIDSNSKSKSCTQGSLMSSSSPSSVSSSSSPSSPSSPPQPLLTPSQSRLSIPRFKIFHGTNCGYKNHSIKMIKKDMNTIYIGRYMFEKGIDGILLGLTSEEHLVLDCAYAMDEIWVPTEWNKEVFLQLSQTFKLKFPPIYVIPEAIDINHFSTPSVSSTTSSTTSATSSISTTSSSSFPSLLNSSNCENETCSMKSFQFLSIFKWEERKGWRYLLKAYWTIFSKTDPVVLRLQTYRPHFFSGEQNITQNLINYAQEMFHRDLSELASVHLGNPDYDNLSHDTPQYQQSNRVAYLTGQSPMLTRDEMKELYLQADTFILPTRGEGWGLPIVEAMGTGLPVIVTNYSGPTAYTNQFNSFLIPVEINEITNRPLVLNDGYVVPSLSALMRTMLVVYQNETERQLKGILGRQLLIQNFHSNSIVDMMMERMNDHAKMRGWVTPNTSTT